MSRLGAAARTSAWVLLGKGAERVTRLAVIVVLARLLDPRGFGAYSVAFAFAEIFAVFTDLGLNAVLVRELAKDRDGAPRLLGAGVVLKLIFSILSFAAAWAAAFLALAPGELRASALAATFALFLSFRVASLRWVFEAPFEAGLRMGAPVAIGLASELLSAACLLGAAWAGWPLPALIGAQLAALLPGCLLLARRAAAEVRPRLAFDPALWGRLLRAALPVGAANLFLIAYSRTDILMLQWLADTTAVGMYAAAFKLTGSLDVIPLALATPLLPLLAAAFAGGGREEAGRLYRGAVTLACAMAVPVAAGGTVLAAEITRAVYGAGYAPSAGALRVLAWAAVFHFALYVMTTAALAAGREKLFTAYAGLLALLNVALDALLIPPFGFLGASWATFLAEGLLLAAGAAVLRRELGLPEGRALAGALGAGAAVAALLAWLPLPLWGRLAGAALLYAGWLWGGRVLPPEILRMVRASVSRGPFSPGHGGGPGAGGPV